MYKTMKKQRRNVFHSQLQHEDSLRKTDQSDSKQERRAKMCFHWDREHLYAENQSLKIKLKQLMEVNTKTKTKLIISEKELNSFVFKNRQISHHSVFNDSTVTQFKQMQTDKNMFKSMSHNQMEQSGVQLMKERQSRYDRGLVFKLKTMIKELKQSEDRLNSQVQTLKKCSKLTMYLQLQAENKELKCENERLGRIIRERKEKYRGDQEQHNQTRQNYQNNIRTALTKNRKLIKLLRNIQKSQQQQQHHNKKDYLRLQSQLDAVCQQTKDQQLDSQQQSIKVEHYQSNFIGQFRHKMQQYRNRTEPLHANSHWKEFNSFVDSPFTTYQIDQENQEDLQSAEAMQSNRQNNSSRKQNANLISKQSKVNITLPEEYYQQNTN